MKEYKLAIEKLDVSDIDVGDIELDSKIPSIGIFDFRSLEKLKMAK